MTETSPLESASREELDAWHRNALTIREFEQAVMELFSEGQVSGTTHLATGQEAVAVGAASALRQDDFVLCTYRGHHHCLARGMDPYSAMAEILGRDDGCCRGRGGSMHLTDASLGLLGSYAIVGAHLPIAVGVAWASQMRGLDSVTVAFFGDGTTTIGAFHEALGLASVWRLPVVFVCENNLYSEYTPIDQVVSISNPAADRAGAYAIPAHTVDGNDFAAVRDVIADAADLARSGGGPSIVEAKTYRHGGHSRADPATYRSPEEVSYWMERDPIKRVEQVLMNRGVTPGELAAKQTAIKEMIAQVTERARRAPMPAAEDLLHHVYAMSNPPDLQ